MRAVMWGFQELQKWVENFDLKYDGNVTFIEHLESWHILAYKIHVSNIQTSGRDKHHIEYKLLFDYLSYTVLFTRE